MKIDLRHGDCLDRLDEMEPDCIELSVSDPPYDLKGSSGQGGFMGKEWDGTGIAFSQEFWTRLFRVMKPGGVVKVFGGSRTFHRMCAAMETAGFVLVPEDSLEAWTYGSGFPKSMNISKAIDKHWGRLRSGESITTLKERLRELFDLSGKTRKQIDEECGFRACNYLSAPGDGKRPDPWANVLPPSDKWEVLKRVLGADDSLDELFAEAEREVIGRKKVNPGVAFSSDGPTEVDVTASGTEEARRWEGWGTALKPAWEPIVVAHKPSVG